jgi:hypothetical protein
MDRLFAKFSANRSLEDTIHLLHLLRNLAKHDATVRQKAPLPETVAMLPFCF